MVYTEKVMDHFKNPRNVGEIENADGVGTVVEINPIKGTVKVSVNESVKSYHRDDVKVISTKQSRS
jgi:NifU-like protein involved in Fe-S cluster formation